MPFNAAIASEPLLSNARDQLRKHDSKPALSILQWLDHHAVYLGISSRLWGADRVLFLLHTDESWTGKEGSLRHFAVLSVDLGRDEGRLALGASSARLVIYDSKRVDSATGLRLDDDAIKLRWVPQVAVAMRLLGAAAEGAQVAVADVQEQHPTNNDCGVHAIM